MAQPKAEATFKSTSLFNGFKVRQDGSVYISTSLAVTKATEVISKSGRKRIYNIGDKMPLAIPSSTKFMRAIGLDWTPGKTMLDIFSRELTVGTAYEGTDGKEFIFGLDKDGNPYEGNPVGTAIERFEATASEEQEVNTHLVNAIETAQANAYLNMVGAMAKEETSADLD